jgi:endonuclease III
VQRLESLFGNVTFDDAYWRERNEPFWLIAETILSQNTSSANSRAAFRNLFSTYQTVKAISLADVQDIERVITQAGLYEAKARSISAVAREVMETYKGDTCSFIGGTYQSARERLQKVLGIGPKTADVVLVFARESAWSRLLTRNRYEGMTTSSDGSWDWIRIQCWSLTVRILRSSASGAT